MIEIECTYYAMMRERCGSPVERLQTDATTPAELYEQVAATHGFPLHRAHLKVAINDAFSTWDAVLQAGDRVAFIPPVAGGTNYV